MKRIKTVYLYLFIFCLIYIEFGYRMVIVNQFSGFARMLLLLLLTIPILLYKKKIYMEPILLFACIALYIFLSSFRDNGFWDYILLLIPIFLGFIISVFIEIKDFINTFCNVILFLAIFSLGIYCVNIFAPYVIKELPYLGNVYSYSAEIHDSFFSVAITGAQNIRNYGIAWEPGAFSLLLCVSLLFELTFFKVIDYRRIWILIIAVATTFSTTGYFVVAGFLYSILLSKKIVSRREKNIAIIIFIIIISFYFFVPNEIYNLVFSKLRGLFSGDSSNLVFTTKARINAVIYPIMAFFNSPLVGIGYEQFSILNKTMCGGLATNTILNWYAVLGAFFGVPCTFGLLRFIVLSMKKIKIPRMGIGIAIVSMILLLSTESLLRISLVYIFIFWGFQSKTLKKIEQIER
ncbi:MAG: hypothetical protein RR623_06270 [Bacilli bacterium]